MSELHERYFNWMYDLVIEPNGKSYRNLLRYLNSIPFTWTNPLDANRESDGYDLRYRFGYDHGIDNRIIASELDISTCSTLEMMVALCIRCEDMMGDPMQGDRTKHWFRGMISSLDLSDMTDENFDADKVYISIDKFLNHEYRRDGFGGLFYIHNSTYDLRRMEIWQQLNLYLSKTK